MPGGRRASALKFSAWHWQSLAAVPVALIESFVECSERGDGGLAKSVRSGRAGPADARRTHKAGAGGGSICVSVLVRCANANDTIFLMTRDEIHENTENCSKNPDSDQLECTVH